MARQTIISKRSAATAHRADIAVPDKLIPPVITVADSAVAGSMTAVAHGVAVVVGNEYGTATASGIVTVTPTIDKSIAITIPAVESAEFYDIFLSTSETEPLWVARATPSLLLSGAVVTAVGTIAAASPTTEGIVTVKVNGTGVKVTDTYFATNKGYLPSGIDPISCKGYSKAYIYVSTTVDDLRTAPSVTVLPFLQSGLGWMPMIDDEKTLTGFKRGFSIDVSAADGLKVLVTPTGTGVKTSVSVELTT